MEGQIILHVLVSFALGVLFGLALDDALACLVRARNERARRR